MIEKYEDEMYKGAGIPSKILKKDVRDRFLHALGKGSSYAICCGFAGISPSAFKGWRKRAKDMLHLTPDELENHPDKIYVDFYWKVKEIESFAAMKWLDKIEQASNVHWQAAAWKLERRHPKDYGRVDRDKPIKSDSSLVDKARSDVTKLMGDDNGQSPPVKS